MKYLCACLSVFLILIVGCAKSDEIASVPDVITVTATPEITHVITVQSELPEKMLTLVPTVAMMATPTLTPIPTLLATPTVTPTVTLTVTPTPVPDTEAPVLQLFGEDNIEIIARTVYEEMGYIATDNCDGELTEQVIITGEVNINLCGTYVLAYEVSDTAGNKAKVERIVVVKQPETVIPEGKIIYLTFDDGPGKYTNVILDILRMYGIKATFFTCGNGQPKLITKIYEEGHTVGIHCRNHDYTVVYESEEAYFEDLFAMQDLIYECTGVRTTLVRFPGGSSNKVSEFNPGIMTRLTEQLTQMGFQYFDWNVSSGDSGTKDTEKILNNMIKGVEKHRWSVVLQHPETREFSMKALERFIEWALEQGYTFLTLENTSPGAHHSVNN